MGNDFDGRRASLFPENSDDAKVRRVFWFIALWCVGVAGASLLALPFEILMRLAMH